MKKRMARVYVAGAFRARPDVNNQWMQHENIERANVIGYKVWDLGAAALTPHKNTENYQGALPDAVYLDGDLAWLEVADAVMLVPGYERSEGTQKETEFAAARYIPIFDNLTELSHWLENTKFFYGDFKNV